MRHCVVCKGSCRQCMLNTRQVKWFQELTYTLDDHGAPDYSVTGVLKIRRWSPPYCIVCKGVCTPIDRSKLKYEGETSLDTYMGKVI